MPTLRQELVPIEALAGGNTDFGPAMRKLASEAQRKYVLIRVTQGKPNFTAAAEMAGYSAVSEGSLKVQGHRLERDPRIQAAIHEEALRQAKHNLGSMLVRASERVGEVMENVQTKDEVVLKAASMIFDRMGLHQVSEHKTTVEHIGDSPETIERVRRLATTLGMDVEKLLGARLARQKPAVIIDVEHEDVVRPPDPLKGFL